MAERLTLAGLQAQLAAVTKERDGLERKHAALATAHDARGEELAAAIAARDGHAATVKELTAASASQAEQIRTLGASLRAYKGSATRARAETLVLRADKSPKARPIGAFPGDQRPASDGDRNRNRIRFEDALRDGPLQLVFSDGTREIREIAPLIVTGDAWREDARGFTLKPGADGEPLLEPGEMTRPEVEIAGVAALADDGTQVGWQQWAEPVRVPRNGRVQLTAGHIRFNF